MSERSHSRTPPADRRQARGIRGGKAARRKREAYVRHELAQGKALEEIPVARPGGQQRPLGTTRFWDPEDLDSASEVEVEEVVEVVEESSAASSSRPSLSEPVRFLRPTPKGYPKPKPSRAVIRPTSVIRPSSSVPSEPVRRSVQVADSVQLFAVGQEHWKTRINSFPIRSGTERVVAVDWHQVTDTCRFGERSAARISEEYRLPDRVLQFYRQVAATKQPGDLLVVCSHIHQSEYNLNNLLWAVQVNNLPIDIVIVTAERIGRAGKLFTLAALTPYSSKVLLLDDNYEISQEWLAHRERFVDIRFCHIKVPRKPRVSDWPSAWNVLDHWDEVRGFLTEGR